jgi:hypothetical protein
VVTHLDPIFSTLAPGAGDAPRTPGREKFDGTAEQGYLHCGPNGAGHFVKMVHNGIEYGLMAAYAEGLSILRDANVGKQQHAIDAETTPLRDPEHYQYDLDLRDIAEVWQRDRFVAARPHGGKLGERSKSLPIRRPCFRLRRGAMDDQSGDRGGRTGACSLGRALPALHLAR